MTADSSGHPSIAGIPLVLGGNVFGWTANGDEGLAVLDAFYEAGGRMIDTADVYSAWIPGHVGGESESFIGEWLASRGVRARTNAMVGSSSAEYVSNRPSSAAW